MYWFVNWYHQEKTPDLQLPPSIKFLEMRSTILKFSKFWCICWKKILETAKHTANAFIKHNRWHCPVDRSNENSTMVGGKRRTVNKLPIKRPIYPRCKWDINNCIASSVNSWLRDRPSGWQHSMQHTADRDDIIHPFE